MLKPCESQNGPFSKHAKWRRSGWRRCPFILNWYFGDIHFKNVQSSVRYTLDTITKRIFYKPRIASVKSGETYSITKRETSFQLGSMTADIAILRVALIFVTMTDCNYTFYAHLVKQQWTVGKILFVHLTSLSEMLSRRSHQLLQVFFLPPIHSIYQMWSYSDQKFPCSHNCKVESFYLKINWNKSYPDLRMMDCIGPFFTIYVGTLGET